MLQTPSIWNRTIATSADLTCAVFGTGGNDDDDEYYDVYDSEHNADDANDVRTETPGGSQDGGSATHQGPAGG